jgi:hypothetical protein
MNSSFNSLSSGEFVANDSRKRALAGVLRVSSRARGMKIFVPGFRALYDTAKGPDSESNEGPRWLFALRLNLIQNA